VMAIVAKNNVALVRRRWLAASQKLSLPVPGGRSIIHAGTRAEENVCARLSSNKTRRNNVQAQRSTRGSTGNRKHTCGSCSSLIGTKLYVPSF